jgi:hypothetical protein
VLGHSGGDDGEGEDEDGTGGGAVASRGVYAPITVGWDALGDPYGGNAKVVVLCFPTELEARNWAEALATVNVSALKTTRPRRLKERAQQPNQQALDKASSSSSSSGGGAEVPGAAAVAAAERRKAAASAAEAEALANPTMYAKNLAGQGLRGATWERLRVTVPKRAGKAMLLKLKGVACPQRKEGGVEKKVAGATRAKKSELKVFEARTWAVVTGFTRQANGKAGAAEASKQVKPLDVVVAVDDNPLPKLDFMAAARTVNSASDGGQGSSGAWDAQKGLAAGGAGGRFEGDDSDGEDEVATKSGSKGTDGDDSGAATETVTFTLWRNTGAVAPLAEGWVPHVVVLDGAKDPTAKASGAVAAGSEGSGGGLFGGLEAAASSAAAAAGGGLSGSSSGASSSSQNRLSAKPDALQGVSPRRYLVLTHSGLLKMHAPATTSAGASSGALNAEPANKLHLKNVHSLQKVVDDATGRWQLLFWLKAKSGGNSGKSVIVAFSGEDEMLLWLDVLSTLKVPQGSSPSSSSSGGGGNDEDDEEHGAGEAGNGDKNEDGAAAVPTAVVPVVAEVMRVRSRGGARRLPRVAQPSGARSGQAAGMATTHTLLGAIAAGGSGGGGGAGDAAEAAAKAAEVEARKAAAQAAATAQAFVADPQAALRDIFGETNNKEEAGQGGSGNNNDEGVDGGAREGAGGEASSLLSLGGSFFADTPPAADADAAGPTGGGGGGRRVGRVSGLGRRPSGRF